MVALVAVLTLLAVSLGVTSADAAVSTPTVTADPSSPTALKVSWPAIKGAAGYRLQYATSPSFSDASDLSAGGRSANDPSTTITGLSVGQTYYVRVADVTASGKVGLMSRAAVAAPRYPYAAPGDLFRTRVTRSSMVVSWKAIAGAPGYAVRVYAKGKPTRYFTSTGASVAITGLSAKTTYSLRAYVQKPGANTPLSRNSPDVAATTTGYAVATTDGLREVSQRSSVVNVAWTAVAGAPAGSAYKVRVALDAALTDHVGVTHAIHGTSAALSGLRVDTTYFAKVYLIDHNGRQINELSDFIVAKTLVPRGRISGTVAGVSGNDLTAAAYDASGNVAKAVTVGGDNAYTIDVRPGLYKVQLMYTGGGNYASAWAAAGSAGVRTISYASKVGVAQNKVTNVPKVTIKPGHKVVGTVVDRAGRPVRDVDVTAITGNGKEREVIALTRSGAGGKFAVQGLATGSYYLRFVYSGDGFTTLNRGLAVTRDLGVKVTIGNASFRSHYKAYIDGTHRVGKTLSVRATPWLAGSFPTTRASMSFQWKRNGAAIGGATGSRYKLVAADRGKTISVTATARRYGYNTGSTTSKGAHIS